MSEISTSFFPCFQPTGSQPGKKCKAGGALGQTFSSLFAHVSFLVLVAQWWDCMCSSKLCAASVRLLPQPSAECGDPALVCGCLWGLSTPLGPCCLKQTFIIGKTMGFQRVKTVGSLAAIRALLLSLRTCTTNQSHSQIRKSQWCLELFILATVTSYHIQICVNVILSWCFLH